MSVEISCLQRSFPEFPKTSFPSNGFQKCVRQRTKKRLIITLTLFTAMKVF